MCLVLGLWSLVLKSSIRSLWVFGPRFSFLGPGFSVLGTMPRHPFGANLSKALAEAKDITQDLDVVELWSGVGSIAGAAQEKFFKAETIELTDGQDLTSKEGFKEAEAKVLRLGKGSLLWMGLPCKSFVFLNASNCKRNPYNQYKGDTSYQPVKEGNLFANEAKYLGQLALQRGVQVVIENPPQSTLWQYLPTSFMKQLSSSAVCHRCSFEKAPDGKRLWKQYKFYCSDPWIGDLQVGCKCQQGHIALTSKQDGKVTGKLDLLSESAAYPIALGQAVISAWSSQDVHDPVGEPRASKRSWQSLDVGDDNSPSSSASKPRRFWQEDI